VGTKGSFVGGKAAMKLTTLYGAEVQNAWIYTSNPAYILMLLCLIKQWIRLHDVVFIIIIIIIIIYSPLQMSLFDRHEYRKLKHLPVYFIVINYIELLLSLLEPFISIFSLFSSHFRAFSLSYCQFLKQDCAP
jgi:hypothetical protein